MAPNQLLHTPKNKTNNDDGDGDSKTIPKPGTSYRRISWYTQEKVNLSRKGCVVNGQTTKSSNKGVRPSRSSRLAVCHTGNHMSLFFYAGGYHIGNSFPPRPVSKTPGFPTCGSDGVSDVHGSKVHLSPGGDQVSGRFLASDASYFVLFLRFAIGVEIGISLIGFVLIRVDESDLLLCHSVKVMLCMSLDGTK